MWRTDNARGTVAAGVTGLCNSAATGTSGVNWRSLNVGYGVTQFYQGLPFSDGRSVFGGTQDNGTIIRRAGTGLNSWQNILGGDGTYVAVHPNNPNVLYAASQNSNFQKSTNGGSSFSSARVGIEPAVSSVLDDSGNFNFITPFVMDPNNSNTLWLGGQRLYRTTNAASSSAQASSTLAFNGKTSAIAVAPGDSDRVLVGTSTGGLHRNTSALSANSGTRWRGRRPRKAWVSWVAFDPNDTQTMYATYAGFGGNHVYRSTNGGGAWRSIDGAGAGRLPDIPVHNLVVDPESSSRIWLGTDLGVFVTIDGGATWAVENAGFGNIVTESLAYLRVGARRFLFAFTHGRGAWKATLKPAK